MVEYEEAQLKLRLGDGPWVRLNVESLLGTGRLAVARLLDHAALSPVRGRGTALYLTDRLTPELRHRLAEQHISWIEKSGAVHVHTARYYVHDIPEIPRHAPQDAKTSPVTAAERPAKLVGRSGLCAEVLLLWSLAGRETNELPPLTQTSLADAAGVPSRLAARVLHRLESLSALEPARRGKRTVSWHVTNVDRLLETWAREDSAPPRTTRAYVYARHPRELAMKIEGIRRLVGSYAVGGSAAANTYAPTLTADPTPTIWIPESVNPDHVARLAGGEVVESGANVVFWQAAKDTWARFANQQVVMDSVGVHLPVWTQTLLQGPGWATAGSLASLPLVSPVRALQQALRDESGRSEEVALALSERLGIAHGA